MKTKLLFSTHILSVAPTTLLNHYKYQMKKHIFLTKYLWICPTLCAVKRKLKQCFIHLTLLRQMARMEFQLKCSRKLLLQLLLQTKLFNLSIQLCRIPHAWKDAIVMPIPKKQGTKTPTEFRPISFLPILSKVLERHFYLLISEHISDHSPLSTCQFGFQSGKSTISALLSVTQDWFRQLEKRQEIGAVFFDFKKSF